MGRLCLKIYVMLFSLSSTLSFFTHLNQPRKIIQNDICFDQTSWTKSVRQSSNSFQNVCSHTRFKDFSLHSTTPDDEIDQFTPIDDDLVLDEPDEPEVVPEKVKPKKKKAKTKKQLKEEARRADMENTVFRPPKPSGEYLSPWDHPMSVELLEEAGTGRKGDAFTIPDDEFLEREEEEELYNDPIFKKGMRGLVVMLASNYSEADIQQVKMVETAVKERFGDDVGFQWVHLWFDWRVEETNQRQMFMWFEGIENRELFNRESEGDKRKGDDNRKVGDINITEEMLQKILEEVEFLTCDETFFHSHGDLFDPYEYDYMGW